MNNFIILKKLGNGVFGTTYLIKNKSDGKKYALKRQKILNSEVEKSTKSKIWREIKFATSNGYYHTDIHSKNVAYKKQTKNI
jgi:serine/threonine protein kinase